MQQIIANINKQYRFKNNNDLYKNDDAKILLIQDYNKREKKKIVNKKAFRNTISILKQYIIYRNGYKYLVLNLVKNVANQKLKY